MRRVLFDTNIYTHFKKNDPLVVERVRCFDYIALSTIVLGELYCGFKLGSRKGVNVRQLEAFLDTPRVYTLHPDETTAEFYAAVYSRLRRNGTPVPTNDMWIAALAMQHGLGLFTLDKHFKHIDGLMLV